MDMAQFRLHFLGTRGTLPRSGKNFSQFGGSTSCIEVVCGDRLLYLDSGSGIYNTKLATNYAECDILLSHTHIDHIQGFPFFPACYKPGNVIRLWAGHLKPKHTLKHILSMVVNPPIFPIPLDKMRADIHYYDFIAGESLSKHACFNKHDISIDTMLLSHPDHATAYRITYGGKSFCYVTDVEYLEESVRQDLIHFVKGTDVLIHDATYTDENYLEHKGWGHSTWQQCVAIAQTAEVSQLICFHHDPNADDKELQLREGQLQKIMPNACLARDGMEIKL